MLVVIGECNWTLVALGGPWMLLLVLVAPLALVTPVALVAIGSLVAALVFLCGLCGLMCLCWPPGPTMVNYLHRDLKLDPLVVPVV